MNDNLGDDFEGFLTAACKNMLDRTKSALYICMSSSELNTLQSAFRNAGGKAKIRLHPLTRRAARYSYGHQGYYPPIRRYVGRGIHGGKPHHHQRWAALYAAAHYCDSGEIDFSRVWHTDASAEFMR